MQAQELSRRRFLTRSLQGLAALTTGSLAADTRAQDSTMLPILDTHQHLWDLSKFTLPWLAGNPGLRRSYLTADYLEAARGPNIVQAVYIEVDVEPSQQQAEAEHVLGLCRDSRHPTTAAVISGRPASDAFTAYIRPLAGQGAIKGVRQVLHGPGTPRGYCLDAAFVRGIRLLGQLGLRYDLCFRAPELADAVQLVDLCPDTRFVLDHCGNASPQDFAAGASEEQVRGREQWKRDIAALAQRKHVVCKISGIVAQARPGAWTAEDLAPIIDHCLNEFGPQRVMFGSDWPVCTQTATLAQWVNALREIVAARPQAQQRLLWHDNALRFYELAEV